MKIPGRFLEDDLLGVRFALNVFLGTTLVWVALKIVSDASPIWAIASMIAATDPVVPQARKVFRGRILNAMVGCAVGLLVVVFGHSSDWELSFALAATVFISTYVVRIPVMWRQAPIIFGCVVGLSVTLAMSRIWPMKSEPGIRRPPAAQNSLSP